MLRIGRFYFFYTYIFCKKTLSPTPPQARHHPPIRHVIPLLMAILPGIDPNDTKKCMVTFQFIYTIVTLVKMANFYFMSYSED